MVVFVAQRIDRYSYILRSMCVPRTAAVPGSAQLHFYFEVHDSKPMPFFDLRIRWAESSDFQVRFYPDGFCSNIGLHTNKETDQFFRSKSKNLKLGIGSRKNQPYFGVTMREYRVDVVPNLPK